MNPKIKFLIAVAIIAYYFLYSKIFQESSSDVLELPTNKEILVSNDSVKFESDPFSERVKVVTYLKDDAISEIPRWIPYIRKYPNISFIFYFNSENKEYVIGGLKHFKFPLPVFLDTNSQFKKYGLICFVVNEKNEVIENATPTLPNFDALLKKHAKN